MNIVSGHASSDLREAFEDAIAAYEGWEDGEAEPTVCYGEAGTPISRIFGMLWNCTDTVPVLYVSCVADLQHWSDKPVRQGASYAQCARIMRSLVGQHAG